LFLKSIFKCNKIKRCEWCECIFVDTTKGFAVESETLFGQICCGI
jgi:hypothetical protein